jgi:hypothetical protein
VGPGRGENGPDVRPRPGLQLTPPRPAGTPGVIVTSSLPRIRAFIYVESPDSLAGPRCAPRTSRYKRS